MKKKLCIILNKKDLCWARKIINKNINNKDFIVIAPTFDGVVAIKNICSNYYNCQDLAWKINKLDLHQQANKILLRIFKLMYYLGNSFFLLTKCILNLKEKGCKIFLVLTY